MEDPFVFLLFSPCSFDPFGTWDMKFELDFCIE